MKRGAGAKKHALLTEIADIVDDRVVTNDTYLTHISGLVSRIPVLYPFLDFCTKASFFHWTGIRPIPWSFVDTSRVEPLGRDLEIFITIVLVCATYI